MFQPVSAFLALRYATADKQNSFVSFINLFSVAGIALGLMSLIIVLSVMNGFEGQLKKRILGIVPQIVAHAEPHEIDETQFPGVYGKMAYAETEGVIQAQTGLRGMRIQGIVPTSMENSIVADNMVTGSLGTLTPGSFNVVIGRALAVQLDIRVGDRLRLMVAGASIYTPLGRIPSQRLVTVSGVYSVGSQMDDKVIFMALDDLKRLMRLASDSPSDTRLFLEDAFNYQEVVLQLDRAGVASDNWRERQGPLFDAVKMEKNMMFMMLLLVIAVAAFNIVSALVMVVTEKQGDIAILQTQGMAPGYVMLVFVLNGIFNGVKGALVGLVLGVGVTLQLNNVLDLVHINLALSADGHGIPIDLRWHQVVTVTLFSLALCLVASIYPAYRAMKVQPASALQND
ncbi:lipoprotein-releasing ABC transporter permease subunit [Aestuariibacter sp. A3R04]|uniref:lipoprotein-releasing ABC transporter permease subunit n=1 Tax=Aestuariibacter sp. A3R04 TaxID=2841571 RepID=UPI001C08F3A8|nr:lipoprotein-releasing ABC transporter permease subunit [Aestuariibacter sp. A3R04]MBU3022661.1 lipoprotein-releasing ABC transporter permease subunit [Aestuariibacter sp. A3R04]